MFPVSEEALSETAESTSDEVVMDVLAETEETVLTGTEDAAPVQADNKTVKAVETVINAGRTVDRAAIGTCAKRILEGAGTEGGQDLKRYDKYMKEAE